MVLLSGMEILRDNGERTGKICASLAKCFCFFSPFGYGECTNELLQKWHH